jgi:Tol biopolymer transport system component
MSKTSIALTGILILSAGILVARSVPQGEDSAVLLRAAIEKEEVDGNLEAAIEQYKHVIKIAGANRAVAAQALLRLGGCYEKRGPEEARRTYEQLIRDYGEQAKEVAAARQRLVALTAGAPATARTGDSRLAIRRVPDYKTVGSLDMLAKPSPDGKYFAVTDWKSGNLMLLDAATGTLRALTSDGAIGNEVSRYPMFSVWSRDSRRIACDWALQTPNEDRVDLRIIPLDVAATPPQTISMPGTRWITPLDWSPDGSRLLCSYGPPAGGTAHGLVAVVSGNIERLDVPADGWRYQFTPDGRHLVYSAPADGKSGPQDIYLRNLQTGTVTPVVQHPSDDLVVGVLPGSDWLFFVSDRRGPLDLWAVRFREGKGDGQPLLVKQGLGRFYPLGFTNDGTYYYATLSATDDVFLADFDRGSGRIIGEARKLTTRWDGFSGLPSFSPDGVSLAYLVKRRPMPIPTGVFDSLVVQSLKNPTAEPVVVGFEEFDHVAGPSWLTDGSGVVLAGYRNQNRETALCRVDLPSLRKTIVYSPAAGRRLMGHEPAPGGSYFYLSLGSVSAPTAGRADQVVRVDVAGGNERGLFQAPQGQTISTIALSPDGAMLSIITRLDRVHRALLVMPSEGGTPRQILDFQQHTGGGVSHVWAPDGRSILYVVRSEERKEGLSFELRRVRADGTAAPPDAIYRWPGQFFSMRFHPNGRLLAFTGRLNYSSSAEVWVMENLREELKLLAPPAPGRLP